VRIEERDSENDRKTGAHQRPPLDLGLGLAVVHVDDAVGILHERRENEKYK
jgi:hypothetical protein